MYMQNKKASDLTYLSTLIAVELTKDKNADEIFELKTLLNQVVATMSTIWVFKSKK